MKQNKQGYVLVKCPDHPDSDKPGNVKEHRLVVEKFIKRYLSKEEVVHHINLVKSDNRISNLMVFQSNKDHMKFHTKLRQYGYTTGPMKRLIASRWRDLELLDEKLGRKRNIYKQT